MNAALVLAAALLFQDAPAAKSPPAAPALPTRAEAEAAMDRGLDYLVQSQNKNGSWGGITDQMFPSGFANPATYDCWRYGTTGLAVLTLLEFGHGDAEAAAMDKGLEFLIAHPETKRPADWDIDNVWSLIYGLNTLAHALNSPRFADSPMRPRIKATAELLLSGMAQMQSPRGGWGYYADPDSNWRPEWATSFTTSAGLLALVEAKEAGLKVDDKIFRAAVKAVEICRLPNGAVSYDVSPTPRHFYLESIDQVKGSLGRIQVANFALSRAGATVDDKTKTTGLDLFFEHHRFLDVARNKPIPHEAYYQNAAYFYLFGHHYAACVIESLPKEQRAEYTPRLWREIIKTQQKDGAMWDFWIANSTKPYGTAFGVMALGRTLRATKDGAP